LFISGVIHVQILSHVGAGDDGNDKCLSEWKKIPAGKIFNLRSEKQRHSTTAGDFK
jgi:hypothetical protein